MENIPFEHDWFADRELGCLHVGRGTYWDPTTAFVTFIPAERIIVGRYCSLSAKAVLMTGGEHYTSTVSTWPFDNFFDQAPNPSRTYRVIADTTIESDVWVGRGAHISGGARIHNGAVLGAGAVVTRDIPPYAIAVGNPATVKRLRFPEPIVEKLLEIAWWDWPAEIVRERREYFYGPIEAFVERFGQVDPDSGA